MNATNELKAGDFFRIEIRDDGIALVFEHATVTVSDEQLAKIEKAIEDKATELES